MEVDEKKLDGMFLDVRCCMCEQRMSVEMDGLLSLLYDVGRGAYDDDMNHFRIFCGECMGDGVRDHWTFGMY